jgi:hypothetical protein
MCAAATHVKSFKRSLSLPDCLPLEDKLLELRSCRSLEYAKALKKVEALIETMQRPLGFSTILTGRIQFIASALQVGILSSKELGIESELASVLTTMANMKNALQIEAVFFGTLQPNLTRYYHLYSNPLLKKFLSEFPKIFNCIDFSCVTDGFFKIAVDPLADYFDSLEILETDRLYDRLMLGFFHSGSMSEDGKFITIPTALIPSQKIIKMCLDSSDKRTQAMGQIFTIFQIEHEAIFESSSPFPICADLFGILGKGSFDAYLEKKPLTPFFCELMTAQKELLAKGFSNKEIFITPNFIHRLHKLPIENWQQESADTFTFIRKIELYVKKIFPVGFLDGLNAMIKTKGCDQKIVLWGDHIRTLSYKGKTVEFPIYTGHPFCESVEEFNLLPVFQTIHNSRLKTVEEPKAAKEKPKRGKTKPQPVAEASACSSEKKPKEPPVPDFLVESCEPEDDLETIVSAEFLSKIKTSPKIESSSPTFILSRFEKLILDSIEETKGFLADVKFEKRVSDWWISDEEGFSHRSIDAESVDYEKTKAHYAITHDFPPEILIFACNRLYSFGSVFNDPGSLEFNHFTSCIMINDKKYKLSVAFNRFKSCYHLYAEKIDKWKNYLNLKDAAGEFPSLGALERAPILDIKKIIDDANFNIDSSGNAIFEYKGRTIKVIRLI